MDKNEMGKLGDVEAAVCAGAAAVGVEDRFKVVDLGNGRRVVIGVGDKGVPYPMVALDGALAEASAAPPRRTGTATLHEVMSFIAHVNRYKVTEQTTVWADAKDFTVQVVFDDDPAGGDLQRAGWGEHRARYTCPRSPEWLAWIALEGKEIGQAAFAQFLEDRLEDIASKDGFPKPAELLDMARNLVINATGKFKKTIDPTSGTGTLVCESEHGAGSTRIPRAFVLGLRVFEGGHAYKVEARIRFVMREATPIFSYVLHRRAEIERDAFNDVRETIAKGTGLAIFAGNPGA